MSRKLTIIKVLPKDGELSPSVEDLERWRNIFAKEEMTLQQAAETGEIEFTTLAEKVEDEHYLTLVRIGDDTYSPSVEDLEEWRKVFEQAAGDPDFKVFTHPAVEVSVIRIGDIVAVE